MMFYMKYHGVLCVKFCVFLANRANHIGTRWATHKQTTMAEKHSIKHRDQHRHQ